MIPAFIGKQTHIWASCCFPSSTSLSLETMQTNQICHCCHFSSFSQKVIEQQLYVKGGYEEDFASVDANLLLSVLQKTVIRPLSQESCCVSSCCFGLKHLIVWMFPCQKIPQSFVCYAFFFFFLNKHPQSRMSHKDLFFALSSWDTHSWGKCCLPLK